jgi:glucose-1-phosphate thymidylyltransferase
MLMAFSDTLINNDFSFLADETAGGVAFVKPVPDPRRFGVAEVDQNNKVTRLVEKPQDIKNNLAVVGCYYFEEAEDLISAIEEQIKRNISLKNEYFLADAINIMLERNLTMRTEMVDVWLDAGTSDALLETNRYLLEHGQNNADAALNLEDTVIIPPVNIHPTARVNTSVIGPHVSLGEGAVVNDSTIRDSIIGPGTHVTSSMLENSLIGHNVNIAGQSGRFNLGDNSWALK